MPSAPTSRWPTVLLSHELPDATSHVDWMIASEPDGRESLVTFRLDSRIDEIEADQGILARRIDDHRAEYLTFEGPVSGDRGTVRRLTRGTVVSWERSGDQWQLEIEWPDPKGGLRRQNLLLSRRGPRSDDWLIEASGPARINDATKGTLMPTDPNHPAGSRIQHTPTQIGSAKVDDTAPLPVVEGVGPSTGASRITAFGKEKRHEDNWSRSPNTTGQGAIHVKTFHSKLTSDALEYMDQCINEWLDAHPQYEVKFTCSTVGTVTSKVKEPNIICQVWV